MKTNATLAEKLSQYRLTLPSQPSQKSPADWLAYAAAASASVAMAGNAEAAIIYSGIQNVTAQIDPSVQSPNSLANNQNTATFTIGGSQFLLNALFIGAQGSGGVKYMGGAGVFVDSYNNALMLGSGGGPYSASFLQASQADIGANGYFSATGAGHFHVQTVIGGSSGNAYEGQFPIGGTGIVGIRLATGNYGWIRLRIEDLGVNQPFNTLNGGVGLGLGENFADKVTAIDWAYDNSGAAIHAGDVPEPSALALLAAGAAGIGVFRRRKAEAATRITAS